MIQKRILYILISILAVMSVILIAPIKKSLYEYNCSYRIAQDTIVSLDLASTRKVNVKNYINIISQAIPKDELVCKKQKKRVFNAGFMINVYKDALKTAKTSHNLIIRASMLNAGYYKEMVHIDHKFDTFSCIYKDIAFFCTPDRFPENYSLSQCPESVEAAKKELSKCYSTNIFFMQ